MNENRLLSIDFNFRTGAAMDSSSVLLSRHLTNYVRKACE